MTGWNMPPGCSPRDIPGWDNDERCGVCFKDVDDCICPECPHCGEQGNIHCYGDSECSLSPTKEIILARSQERIRRTQEMLDECKRMYDELADPHTQWDPALFDIEEDGLND